MPVVRAWTQQSANIRAEGRRLRTGYIAFVGVKHEPGHHLHAPRGLDAAEARADGRQQPVVVKLEVPTGTTAIEQRSVRDVWRDTITHILYTLE